MEGAIIVRDNLWNLHGDIVQGDELLDRRS